MKGVRSLICSIIFAFSIFSPKIAKADMFGGDVVVLTKILLQAIQQLEQLRMIYQTGKDSHNLMRDLNRGIRHGLEIVRILNPKFDPGIYGGLDNAASVQRAIEDLYGMIPKSSESRLQEAQDRAASESIAMNGDLFRFADDVDSEARRIISHAQDVSPQGAAKLTAESIAILIGVSTQVLRTNSMMLKMMGQNMALSNRKEKLQTSQFQTQYKEISNGIGSLPPTTKLRALGE